MAAQRTSTSPTSITIGTFDGVHAGHGALVRACREHAGTNGRVVVLAFDPHPLTRIRPEAAPTRLTTFDRKRELLIAAGADEVVQLRPDDALLSETPEEFLKWLVATHAPTLLVEGSDFRFGHDRAGDIGTLRRLGPALGFGVTVVDQVDVVLGDHTIAKASSSLVRWLLGHGRAGDASRVLGRPHQIAGTVVQGDQLGRTIGFPTANIHQNDDVLLPCNGVYACRATLPDGSTHPSALNIGVRPTVGGLTRRVEAHLLGGTGDEGPCRGLPEYGWELRLETLAWVREELRFASVDVLRGQIARDVARVRAIVDGRMDGCLATPPAVGGVRQGKEAACKE